jgi:hypothetical protein
MNFLDTRMVKDELFRERSFEESLDEILGENEFLRKTGIPWRPLGDKQSLKEACEEVRRFARQVPWTAYRYAEAAGRIHHIAFYFRQRVFAERMYPVPSRTEVREGLQKISVALESLRGLCLANPASLSKVCDQWPEDGREDFIELMLNKIDSFEKAFKAALANDEFQKKGRPESRRGPYLHLVISAHGLLEQFAGRPPGFGLETDATPGPLVRTVRAIYQYAAGQPALPFEFDRYIAQAERRSKRSHSDTSVATPSSKLRRVSR